MTFILDTNVLIEIENGNQTFIDKLRKYITSSSEVYLAIFTVSEFYYGIMKKSEKNRQLFFDRLQKYKILNTSTKTAILFCELLRHLEQKGRVIPQFDIFIAALALEHGCTLITADAHFKDIPNLDYIIL